jgi:hypothetical protein
MGAKGKAKGALDAVGEKVSEIAHPEREEEQRKASPGNGEAEGS